MLRLKTILFFLILSSSLTLFSQEKWSLEKCIRYAQENSLTVKQNLITISNAELTLQQNKYLRHPIANANASYGVNLGRSIDPTSNSFETSTSQYNRFGVDGSYVIYDGKRTKNSITQSEYNLEAAKLDNQQALEDIALLVAQNYLNILFSEEQLNVAKRRISQSKDQLSQTDKLINAGSLPRANRYDILAQIALDEQNMVAALNSVELSYLTLKQTLLLEPDYDLVIERPNIEIPSDDLDALILNEIYKNSIARQPSLKAGLLREKSATLGIDIAKAGKLPRLSAFANLGTNYSSLARVIDGFDVALRTTDVIFMGNPVTFQSEIDVPVYKNNPYFNQLNENLGGTIGLSFSMPLYDQRQTQINMERAKLNITTAQLQNKQIEQQLKSDINNAVANAKAAKLQLQAAQKSLEAAQISYQNIEKRYKLGAINTLEYTTAQNNVSNAESEVIRSKYDYIFKLKIVDFYQGKPIQL